MTAKTVKNFKGKNVCPKPNKNNNNVISILVLPLKFSQSSTSYHELLMKEHSTRQQSEDKPSDRTLFVLNIPPYATENNIKQAFSAAGPVQNVTFNYRNDETKKGFKNGFIIFQKPLGLISAMQLDSLKPLSTTKKPTLTGIKKWAADYNSSICDPQELQKKVNEFMKKFDKEQESIKKKDKKDAKPDEEGWTVVTRESRRQGFARKKSLDSKIKEKIEQGRKKKELKNFYTFQIRESKMKHLANLRQKFEEDKKKINMLKQVRKFRPY